MIQCIFILMSKDVKNLTVYMIITIKKRKEKRVCVCLLQLLSKVLENTQIYNIAS